MRVSVGRRRLPSRSWGVTATVVTLVALYASGPMPPPPKVKGDAFVTAQTPGILHIEGGECFTDPVYSRVAGEVTVHYVPCEEHADNQSYGFVRLPDAAWDRAAVASIGWQGCGQFFDRRWPDKKAAGLDYYPILPTAETWADGDRTVMCVVYNPTGKLTDSVLPLRS